MMRILVLTGLLALAFNANAEDGEDLVEKRFDERVTQGKNWLRENKDSPDWLKRDKETWELEKQQRLYKSCKVLPESCLGS